jgi:hypothetical protein
VRRIEEMLLVDHKERMRVVALMHATSPFLFFPSLHLPVSQSVWPPSGLSVWTEDGLLPMFG